MDSLRDFRKGDEYTVTLTVRYEVGDLLSLTDSLHPDDVFVFEIDTVFTVEDVKDGLAMISADVKDPTNNIAELLFARRPKNKKRWHLFGGKR